MKINKKWAKNTNIFPKRLVSNVRFCTVDVWREGWQHQFWVEDIPQKIEVSRIRKSALSDHAKVFKHLIELKKVTTFLWKELTPKMTSLKQFFDSETFATNTQTMKAGITWALKTVVSGLSHNWNNDISNCCAFFANNATAEQFSCGRTKSTFVVNHGSSPYFQGIAYRVC